MSQFGDRQRVECELKSVFEQADRADEELQGSLARYACVLANGYLEAVCREVIEGYCGSRSHPSIARYVQRRLKLFGDPNIEKVLQLVGDFGDEYRSGIEAKIDDKIKDCVNSICAHRNNIAHGRRSDISIARIRFYYEQARKLHQYLMTHFPCKT
jgi:hypothetical protein